MSTLRIAWVTQRNMSPTIALAAANVAFELARQGHPVTLLRIGPGGALAVLGRSAPHPVRSLNDVPTADLRSQFDVIVAHLGDRYSLHGAQLSRLRDLSAVGIFHETFVANLASDGVAADEPVMRQLVRDTHRAAAWSLGEPLWGELPRVPWRRSALEWLAHRAAGAVANARHYAERLSGAYPALGVAVGERARGFTTGRHATTVYVEALLPRLEQVVARRPILDALRQLSDTLAEFELSPDDPAMARVAAALTSLQATIPRKCHDPSTDNLGAGTHSYLPP